MTRYYVADTETTGVDPDAKAVEIGWIEIDEDFNILNQFESLLDPEHPIGFSASGVHGLTYEDVKNSPTIEEMFSEDDPTCFGRKLEGPAVIIGHRIGFDMRFMAPFIEGEPVELCTLRWVRQQYPNIEDHKLSTLIYALDLPRSSGAHRVMADVMSAYHLLKHLSEVTGLSLPAMAERSKQPMEVECMSWGKHKGMLMSAVPVGYLRWMKANSDLDIDMAYTVDKWLNH